MAGDDFEIDEGMVAKGAKKGQQKNKSKRVAHQPLGDMFLGGTRNAVSSDEI